MRGDAAGLVAIACRHRGEVEVGRGRAARPRTRGEENPSGRALLLQLALAQAEKEGEELAGKTLAGCRARVYAEEEEGQEIRVAALQRAHPRSRRARSKASSPIF